MLSKNINKSSIKIACMTIGFASHFASVKSITQDLKAFGADICVWTDEKFKNELIARGIQFQNLFAHNTPDDCDPNTIPRSVRLTAFSVQNYEFILRSVMDWAPDLILVEGFTLLGKLISETLEIPWILLNSSHIPNGKIYRKLVEDEFPKQFSDICLKSVEILKSRFGYLDATPFDFIVDPSPYGTIHFEPQQWPHYYGSGHREVHYWGSSIISPVVARRNRPRSEKSIRLYAAFGTMVWNYWPENAYAIIRELASVSGENNIALTVGLGGSEIGHRMCKDLSNAKIDIQLSSNQIVELEESDIFVTHNGLNSTHEAVRKRVPMLSVPFVGDQNSLARQSSNFGLGLTARDTKSCSQSYISADSLKLAIDRLVHDYITIQDKFDEAIEWDMNAIQMRPKVISSILEIL